MILSKLITCLVLCVPVLAGQFPRVSGVIGDVPAHLQSSSASFAERFTPALSTQRSNETVGKLRYKENTGFCETTKKVYQASGYGDIAANKSVWFWFFEARHNARSAPLAIWLNGGPGSSSMIGLFQEHGPCRVNNQSTAFDLNPASWNDYANMLYIDQPVGVGFSHGATEVGTSEEAAADIWTFLQIFFKDSKFKHLATRKFALWTESYGGHYGPTASHYILEQNKAIKNHTIKGIPIKLEVLGIGNGLTDPALQYPKYLTYAETNAYHPLVNSTVLAAANTSLYAAGGCLDRIANCNTNLTNAVCSNAQSYCNNRVLSPLSGNWDVYYVPAADPDAYPPDFTDLINKNATLAKIGAEKLWEETNYVVYENFAATGDWMRTKRPYLQSVIDAGVRTILYDGTADYICNYQGFEALANGMQTRFSKQFQRTKYSQWKVNGQVTGQYRNAGTFTFVQVYGAGHEVPAYSYGTLKTGEAALVMFNQIMKNQDLHST